MTNNEQLRDIMKRYGISHARLCELIGVDTNTTHSWTCSPQTTRHRNISAQTLLLLKLLIKDEGMTPTKAQS